jgi:hypothetical protein
MAEETISQTYLLKILEIHGKSVTQKYIAVLKDTLDKRGLKYSINIVVDENQAHIIQPINEQSGGGSGSTFPYNVFENTLDRILMKRNEQLKPKGWITSAYDKLQGYNQKRKSLIDNLFLYKPLNDLQDVAVSQTVMPSEPAAPSPEAEGVPILEEEVPSPKEEEAAEDIPNQPEDILVADEPTNIVEPDDVVLSSNVTFPENYTGVLHIQVTIYGMPHSNPNLTLGLRELTASIMN